MSRRLPEVGGVYIQMEDELASLVAVIGASQAGAKAMTATSGPGFSLMMEQLGLAIMTETPCVLVNVMRGGPSTGQPTKASQGDVMQARWGAHGDYEIIALAPSSPQEFFDYTIEAFNLSEEYRTPVIVLADELVAHMREKIVIPPEDEIKVVNRRKPSVPPEEYFPYGGELIPPMASLGGGYRVHITGLTHDEKGYPDMSSEVHSKLIWRICNKIRSNAEKIWRYKLVGDESPKVAVVAYGSAYRSAVRALKEARREGLNAALLKIETVWPFPEKPLMELSEVAKGFVVVEMNTGQILREVQRLASPDRVEFVSKLGGDLPDPRDILAKVRRVAYA